MQILPLYKYIRNVLGVFTERNTEPAAQDEAYERPKAEVFTPDRQKIVELHHAYATAVSADPEKVITGHYVNDSSFLKRLADDSLAGWPLARPGIRDAIAGWLQDGEFEPYGASFRAALLALVAEALLGEAGGAEEALAWSQKAYNFNLRDLFVQSVYLKGRAIAGGRPEALEETEAWLSTRFCPQPFEMIETSSASEVTHCCPIWLPVVIGHFDRDDLAGIMSSARVQSLRQSILDGSFRHCSRFHCARIVQRDLPARAEIDLAAYTSRQWPKDIVFSHDQSCNLSCPSCRGQVIVVPKSEQVRFDALSAQLVPLMLHADSVKVCGDGDPFGSIHYRNLLKSYAAHPQARRNLILHTNGVLCDERSWSALGLGRLVKKAMVSLDAAREETYDYVRRGGDWARLHRNLEFLQRLKRNGDLESLELLFVIQGRNYREMVEFVELARRYDADKALFQAISNWGSYSEADFVEHNIFSTEHPGHAELLDILDLDVFDDPIVDLFSASKFRRRAKGAAAP